MRLVKPKKALGQHFLKDLQIAQRIADTLDTFKSLPVLEIGPGMGVLTQFLLEAGHDLTVVELDMESVDYLNQNFPDLKGRIIAEDFLKLDLSKLFPGQFCVIGNYPYNISSEKVFDPPPKVKSAVLKMTRNDRKELGCDEKLFKTVVKTSFNQRRKTLRNSMKPLLGKDCPDYALPIFDKRPEQLSVEQFVELTLISQKHLEKQAGDVL